MRSRVIPARVANLDHSTAAANVTDGRADTTMDKKAFV
jgi:hypothetical protein